MSKKLSLSGQSRKTIEEVFGDFVISQTAQGLSEITIATYRCHIHSISKHLDIQKPMNTLTKGDLEAMVVSMRKAGLAHNSIAEGDRVLIDEQVRGSVGGDVDNLKVDVRKIDSY